MYGLWVIPVLHKTHNTNWFYKFCISGKLISSKKVVYEPLWLTTSAVSRPSSSSSLQCNCPTCVVILLMLHSCTFILLSAAVMLGCSILSHYKIIFIVFQTNRTPRCVPMTIKSIFPGSPANSFHSLIQHCIGSAAMTL